jgi:hypothetical protein
MRVTISLQVPKSYSHLSAKQVQFLLKRAIEHDRFWQRQFLRRGKDQPFQRTRVLVSGDTVADLRAR